MRKDVRINKEGVSLESFIKDNEVLLSSLAILAALIVFSKDLTPSYAAGAITFFLIGGMVLLWLEIWFKFPEQVAWRLFLFRYVLLWSIVGIVFCWLYQYRTFWDMTLFIPMTIIAYIIITDTVYQILSLFSFTRKFFGIGAQEKTCSQKLMRSIGILIGFFAALSYGVMFSTGTNLLLDILKLNFPKS